MPRRIILHARHAKLIDERQIITLYIADTHFAAADEMEMMQPLLAMKHAAYDASREP